MMNIYQQLLQISFFNDLYIQFNDNFKGTYQFMTWAEAREREIRIV